MLTNEWLVLPKHPMSQLKGCTRVTVALSGRPVGIGWFARSVLLPALSANGLGALSSNLSPPYPDLTVHSLQNYIVIVKCYFLYITHLAIIWLIYMCLVAFLLSFFVITP